MASSPLAGLVPARRMPLKNCFSNLFQGPARTFSTLFVLNLAAGLFVMLALPHLFPSAHLGLGLFIGDSTSIHSGALRILESWRGQGLSGRMFTAHPALHDWLVATVYFILPAHPLSFLPLQAASMALAGTLFAGLLHRFHFSHPACISGALFLSLNPQTFEWSTQLLRDGIFLAAIFLCLRGLVCARPWAGVLMGVSASLWILLARPHWIRVLAVVVGIFFSVQLAIFLLKIWKRERSAFPSTSLGCFLVMLLCYGGIRGLPEPYQRVFVSYEAVNREARLNQAPKNPVPEPSETDYKMPVWEACRPLWLNSLLFEVYNLRLERIKIGGRSIMDETRFLNSFSEQLAYLPRALQIGLFAPFPNEIWQGSPDGRQSSSLKKNRTWPQEGLGGKTTGLARKIMPWLTLFCSVSLAGLVFPLFDARKRPGIFMLILFCLPQLVLLAMVSPNLGTLVRLRYPFYAPLVCAGLAALVDQRRVWKTGPVEKIRN